MCLICDQALSCVGIKPTICSAPICIFRYEELGLGLELSAEIQRDPDMIDLLISLCYCSANGGRIELM